MARSSLSGSRTRRAGTALALVLAAAQAAPARRRRSRTRTINSSPRGFSEIASARSDFDGDGRPDLVIVLAD
jgi:hypothetical protein